MLSPSAEREQRYKCSSRPLSFASSAVRALIPIRDRPRCALPAPNDLATANVHTEPSFSVAYMACGSPYGVEIAIPQRFEGPHKYLCCMTTPNPTHPLFHFP